MNKKKYYLKIGNQFLGRAIGVDIIIPDNSISNKHLLFFYFDNIIQVMDLNSSNGTIINKEKILPFNFIKLKIKDEIKIGTLSFRYYWEEEDENQENLDTYSNENLSVMAKYDPAEFSEEALKSTTQGSPDLQKISEKLGFLYSFGQRISSIFDLTSLFNFVLQELTLLFPMSTRAVIFLSDNDILSPKIYWHEGKEKNIEQVVYSKTIVNLAINEKKGFIASDFGNNLIEKSKSIIALNLQCTMVAPLVMGNELLGVILLDSSKSIIAFKGDDLKLLSGICNLISVKIINKRLINEVSLQAKNLKISNEQLAIYSQTLEKNNNELIKARDDAEKANKLKSQFLSNISHELRTPLNSILGFSDLLKTNNDEKVTKYAERINNNGNRLMQLINDITELSIIDGENTPNKNSFFSIKSLATVKEQVKKYLQTKPVDINIYFSDDLPDKISADMSKVHKVLLNIAENASKNTNKGFINITFSFKDDKKQYIKVEVEDSGIGILESDLNNIFEEFYQVAGEKQTFKGSGLGLTAAKKLIEQLDGEIYVTSKINIGSVFTFTFKIYGFETETKVTNNKNTGIINKDFSLISEQLKKISEYRFFESSKIKKDLDELLQISPRNFCDEINELIIKLKSRNEIEYRNLLMKMLSK
ncbi:MAG: ATP-binding protein [Cyanobacteriota bacterium]